MSQFEYPIRVYPHHTDYGGIVWHGAYVAWLEEARVEVLRQMGLPFEQLVEADVNLVVADMTLTYRRPLKMGMDAVVLLSPLLPRGIRLPWEYELRSPDFEILFFAATVTLAPVNRSGRIYRRVPEVITDFYAASAQRLSTGNVSLAPRGLCI
ncbi:MAG: acyl-CoA thioesterase [Synechococcus sp.]